MIAAPACGVDGSGLRSIPQLERSHQLVLVTAAGWTSVSAQLRCFERTNADSEWTEVLPASSVVLGRAGLAWGRGLPGASDGGGPAKREADGKSPAGVFPLIEAFGFDPPQSTGITRIRYRQLTPTTEAIDDPESRHYNRIIDASNLTGKDWKSSEQMRRIEPYRWGAVVGHNWDQVPAAGSCIFLHIWEGAGVPTSGCTAMPERQMLRVLRWLDRTKNPMLVQLPIDEYRRLRGAWRLP